MAYKKLCLEKCDLFQLQARPVMKLLNVFSLMLFISYVSSPPILHENISSDKLCSYIKQHCTGIGTAQDIRNHRIWTALEDG